MRRRHRRSGEIPFGFDSFLDVVANVCGIVIRLILVAWVGARSYPSIQKILSNGPVAAAETATMEDISPSPELLAELAAHRRELAEAEARLAQQLDLLNHCKHETPTVEQRRAEVAASQAEVERALAELDENLKRETEVSTGAALSLQDLVDRRQKLLEDVRKLEQEPRDRKVLRYQTPVSQPVQAEQFMFECREGRVTFIDLPALEAEARRALTEKADLLKFRWEVEEVSPTVGAFRLRYTLSREPGLADSLASGERPAGQSGYRYGLSSWVVEPASALRGEDLATALEAGSEFRRLTGSLDPRQAVVTFWVYPDSFGLFRALRDHLYERELVVAGRPLPPQALIAGSRHGTISRGQ